MRPPARFSAVAGCRRSLGVPSVRPGDAIENVDPDLAGLCSSFLLIPRCTKTNANTAAVFRYEFNACCLQRTTDR
jgi:hypothetical protein